MLRDEQKTYLDGIDFRGTSTFGVDWSRVVLAFAGTCGDSLSR
jgi:hypothetical protein